MPDYIDIHAHVNFAAFDADRDEVIRKTLEHKTWMINVGTQKDTSLAAVELAHKYEKGVYAIIGTHPIHTHSSFHDTEELGEGGKEFTSHGESFDYDFYLKLARDPKVVGIGECGLDYYRLTPETEKKQKETFEQHIVLAQEIEKPLMLHIRNGSSNGEAGRAYKDALQMLKAHQGLRGNVHFFAGTWEEAKEFVDLGFTLSFTGVITFASNYDEVIKNIPLTMIMSETDCPYVTPKPYRGKRNEPLYVREVVKRIAAIKNLSDEEVREVIRNTAMKSFGLES
jgi:TatD DNase family protein